MERSEIQEAGFSPDSALLHLGYVVASLHSFSVDTAMRCAEHPLSPFSLFPFALLERCSPSTPLGSRAAFETDRARRFAVA
jgi:hypothetical protein